MFKPTLTMPEVILSSATVTVREDGTAEVTARSEQVALTVAYHIATATVRAGTADDVDTGWGGQTADHKCRIYVTPLA